MASRLLNDRLAACCQISKIESFYCWEEKLESSEEWQLSIKTKAILFKKIACIIKAGHSYKSPQIISLPIIEGDSDYLNWIVQSIIPTTDSIKS